MRSETSHLEQVDEIVEHVKTYLPNAKKMVIADPRQPPQVISTTSVLADRMQRGRKPRGLVDWKLEQQTVQLQGMNGQTALKRGRVEVEATFMFGMETSCCALWLKAIADNDQAFHYEGIHFCILAALTQRDAYVFMVKEIIG